jgi:hypothetical protein
MVPIERANPAKDGGLTDSRQIHEGSVGKESGAGLPAGDLRGALLATLMEATFAAAASGDVETARVAHESAGKLLARIEGPAVEAARVAHEAAGKLLASLP